jgi:hypothetical protein
VKCWFDLYVCIVKCWFDLYVCIVLCWFDLYVQYIYSVVCVFMICVSVFKIYCEREEVVS